MIMALFKKNKKLYERDPKELDLDVLSHLQAALFAKLILVNYELIGRYRKLSEHSEDLDNTDNARSVLDNGAERLEQINVILESELARVSGK
jgi:hypothetical protein